MSKRTTGFILLLSAFLVHCKSNTAPGQPDSVTEADAAREGGSEPRSILSGKPQYSNVEWVRAKTGALYVTEYQKPFRFIALDREHLERAKTATAEFSEFAWTHLFQARLPEDLTIIVPRDDDTRALVPVAGAAGGFNPHYRVVISPVGIGWGNLIHELTHALHLADMKALGQQHPMWIIEGLGTLFESTTHDGTRYLGVANFRLPGLIDALSADASIPLKTLASIDRNGFKPQCFEQSRYLLMYLQEHKQLESFYSEYKKSYSKDPTGIAALEKVTGMRTDAFEKTWAMWVKRLAEEHLQTSPVLGLRLAEEHGPNGLRVKRVVEASSAAKAGILEGDVVTRVNGGEIRSGAELGAAIESKRLGDVLEVELTRQGATMAVEVKLEDLRVVH